jgi:hypothetical protein
VVQICGLRVKTRSESSCRSRRTHGDKLASSGIWSSGELEVFQFGNSRSPEAQRVEVMGHDDII